MMALRGPDFLRGLSRVATPPITLVAGARQWVETLKLGRQWRPWTDLPVGTRSEGARTRVASRIHVTSRTKRTSPFGARSAYAYSTTTMNSFLTRYSSTSPDADIRKAKELYGEDDDVSDMMWGSAGGFGNMASGVPMFKLPAVQDVSERVPVCLISLRQYPHVLLVLAHCVPQDAHRRPCRPFVPYQNQARYNNIGIQVPGRRDCRC